MISRNRKFDTNSITDHNLVLERLKRDPIGFSGNLILDKEVLISDQRWSRELLGNPTVFRKVGMTVRNSLRLTGEIVRRITVMKMAFAQSGVRNLPDRNMWWTISHLSQEI